MTDDDHSLNDSPSPPPQDRDSGRPSAESRWTTRPGTAADFAAVHAVNAAAFPAEAEAGPVDALCEDPSARLPGLSYVAEAPAGSLAACALPTRCPAGGVPALAPAPVAAAPAHERRGAYPAAFGI